MLCSCISTDTDVDKLTIHPEPIRSFAAGFLCGSVGGVRQRFRQPAALRDRRNVIIRHRFCQMSFSICCVMSVISFSILILKFITSLTIYEFTSKTVLICSNNGWPRPTRGGSSGSGESLTPKIQFALERFWQIDYRRAEISWNRRPTLNAISSLTNFWSYVAPDTSWWITR